MADIDLSWIDALAYRGCKTEAEKAARDDMINKGFTFLQDEKTPFDEDQPEQQGSKGGKGGKAANEQKQEAPQEYQGDMASLWKMAQDFQKRHTPVKNTPEYWDALTYDMFATAEKGNQEPFLMDLLTSIFEDFERQAKSAGTTSGL